MGNPCLRCGACCAAFRVSFYWSEADPSLAGTVPPELTEPLNPYRSAMRGTLKAPILCIALEGRGGEDTRCRIYAQWPSPCREVEPWEGGGRPGAKCQRARAAHHLPPLDCAASPPA